MFLIDDLLLMPARGIMAVFREVHNAAQQEGANEAENIRTELSELYMQLETGQLSEADFDRREKELLDRLDSLEKRGADQMADGEHASLEESGDEEDVDTVVVDDDDEFEDEQEFEYEEWEDEEELEDEEEWEADDREGFDEDGDEEEEWDGEQDAAEEVERGEIKIEFDETVGDIPGVSPRGRSSQDAPVGGG